MHLTISSLRRRAGLIGAGAILALLPGLRTAAADSPTQADAFPNYESYIKISGQAPFISGDSAAFANRNSQPAAGSGGIEDLYYTKDLSKTTTVTINGRALGGSNDYLASINVSKANIGSIDTGYKTFRTYYDGVGGFFPLSNLFQKFSPEQLHVDRGAFWATATLALPDHPVFKIDFRDESRAGEKDSSEWAAIVNPLAPVVNGAQVGNTAPANTPFVAPNALTIDEHHQIITASMVGTFGKTTETLKATWDWSNNNDHRNYMRYPGSNVIIDPTVAVLDDSEEYHAKTFRILNQTETKFNDAVALDTGFNFSHLTTKMGGNWITPAYFAALNTVYTAVTAGNIYGGAKVDDVVGNIFLKLSPSKNWSADLGYRVESLATRAAGGFVIGTLATGSTSTASSNLTMANNVTYSNYVDHVATPELSLQFRGIKTLLLYANFDDRIIHGQQHWINPYAASTTAGITGIVTTATASPGSVFFQDANQDSENAKVGANWNFSNRLTIRSEIFRKDHQNRFIGSNDYVGTASYGALYATGYTFTGVKLTVILKPTPQWSFTTRYQPQGGSLAVTANAVTGGVGNENTSGKVRTQIISETVDWTPTSQLYVQGNVNVAYNYLQTAYPAVLVSTTTAIPSPIQNSNNNYVVGSALCGFVINKQTDAIVQGFWSQATNYNPGIAPGGQPYGAGFLEESLTVGLKHKLSDRFMVEGKAGYLRRTDATTGNFTNYRGPLFYVSMTCSL
jgi:hypothetical protein